MYVKCPSKVCSGRVRQPVRVVRPLHAAQAQQPVATRNDQDVLVDLARAFVNTPVLFNMAVAAGRFVIRNTADSKGIAWSKHLQDMDAQRQLLESIKAELEDPNISYPEYYLAPIHGYGESNLCWQAAFEQEPARQVVAARQYPHLPAQHAVALLADNTMGTLQSYWRKTRPSSPALVSFLQKLMPRGGSTASSSSSSSVRSIVDLGCCTGTATQYLAEAFPGASVAGVDLSPNYLAVAELRRRERAASGSAASSITYLHRQAEATGLPSACADVVNIGYVFHECPREASAAILREAFRLLKRGGAVFVADTDSNSAALQKLHPAIFLLREQSEPWMGEFRQLSVPDAMRQAGFDNVQTKPVSERDISWAAVKP